MSQPLHQLAAILMLGSIASANAMAQSAVNPPVTAVSPVAHWPAPVRHVQQVESLTQQGMATQPSQESVLLTSPTFGLHPHQVIQAPNQTSSSAKRHDGRHEQTHPPHSSFRRRIQPAPATLPEANRREIWKTPYSYGYFGASEQRQWSLHHGYRNRSTEWRLQ